VPVFLKSVKVAGVPVLKETPTQKTVIPFKSKFTVYVFGNAKFTISTFGKGISFSITQ